MKIVGIAASTSSRSINKHVVVHALGLLSDGLVPDAETELVDLNDYEMPIYSQDRENADGVPQPARDLLAKIAAADALIISYAEHNGSYTAAFKNVYDWMSRIQQKVYQDTQMVLFSTSPGPGGGRNVLASAASAAPHYGAELRAELSIPRFRDVFDVDKGVFSDPEIAHQFELALKSLARD